jgi:hypothetical protein
VPPACGTGTGKGEGGSGGSRSRDILGVSEFLVAWAGDCAEVDED